MAKVSLVLNVALDQLNKSSILMKKIDDIEKEILNEIMSKTSTKPYSLPLNRQGDTIFLLPDSPLLVSL